MAKLTVTWNATFETTIEVEDPTDIVAVREAASDLNIPEDDATTYQMDTWEVEDIKDEDGNTVEH